jgi:hypothetical protein
MYIFLINSRNFRVESDVIGIRVALKERIYFKLISETKKNAMPNTFTYTYKQLQDAWQCHSAGYIQCHSVSVE